MKKIWGKLIDIGTQGHLTNKEERGVRFINVLSIIIFIIVFIFFILNILDGKTEAAIIEIGLAILMSMVILLNARGKHNLARFAAFVFINSYIVFQTIYIMPGNDIEYVYLVEAMFLLLVFEEKWLYTTLYLVLVFLFYFPQLAFSVYAIESFSYINTITLFIMIYFLMEYYKKGQSDYAIFISEQNERLIKLNEEKNQLLSIAAHDLKSPLKRIEGLISVIKLQSGNLTENQKDLIEKVSTISNEQNQMIMELLDIEAIENRADNIEIENENIVAILNKSIQNFTQIAKNKSIRIHTYIEKNHISAYVDKNYLQVVFDNLLSNAIKFSISNSDIYVNCRVIDKKARVSFKDNGPGISIEDHKKLFGMFQKLSAQPTGGESSSGLGLAISKKYIEEMSGKIWCESDHGKGASFIIELETS